MPGLGDQAAALGRVEHRVDAGGERGAGQARGQPVQSAQHGRRGQLQVGQGMRGGAQLHHDRGRLRPVAHHVTDDQHRPPAGHRHDVIPVAADHVRADRPVPVRDLQARWHLRPGRQQATLQGQRGAPLLSVAPRVVQAGRRAVGQPAGQFGVVRAERRPARGPGERDAAQHHAPGQQRHGQVAGEPGGGRPARGVPADPLRGLGVQLVEAQRRGAGHHLGVRRAGTERQYLADGQRASRAVVRAASQPDRDPAGHRAGPGHRPAELVGQQPLGQVDDGPVGERGHRHRDRLVRRPVHVQRAADPRRRLRQQSPGGQGHGRPGAELGDDQHAGRGPRAGLTAEQQRLTGCLPGYLPGPHLAGRDLGQRPADQVTLPRPGEQHIAHVPAEHLGGRAAEQSFSRSAPRVQPPRLV